VAAAVAAEVALAVAEAAMVRLPTAVVVVMADLLLVLVAGRSKLKCEDVRNLQLTCPPDIVVDTEAEPAATTLTERLQAHAFDLVCELFWTLGRASRLPTTPSEIHQRDERTRHWNIGRDVDKI
jgi:hypothetical protein